ncbi:MAG: TetR/AcrR family transcriptional regulator [Thermoleophilaceae bacterium]|nr:TetR/AcrR family transcriptional regulator [Thermoleophilaceae bacterium]
MPSGKTEPKKTRLSAAELTEQRRGEIYLAAVRVFAEHGFRDASIAQIAAEMGVGHGTIYRYFDNKLAIGEYVVGRAIMRLGVVISEEPSTSTGSVDEYREQVGRIGTSLFNLFIDEPNIAEVLFFVAGELDSELRDQVSRAFDLIALTTEQYLLNGVKKGFLDPELDTFATACAVNGMIFEGARRVHAAQNPVQEGERWTRVVQKMMFDGIAAPA